MNHKKPWTTIEIQTLRELRETKCWEVSAIAIAMGRTPRAIRSKIENMGFKLSLNRNRGIKGVHVDRQDAIIQAFNDGVMIRAVAKQLGLSHKAVGDMYNRLSENMRGQRASFTPPGTFIGAKEMAAIVAPVCGVSPKAVFSSLRMRPAVIARMAVARALRDRGLSYSAIGRALGNRDHTTVINLLDIFPEYQRAYPLLNEAYNAIKDAERMATERLAA